MIKSLTKRKVLFIMQLPPPVHGVSVMNGFIKESSLINNNLLCHYINLSTSKSINNLQKAELRKYILAIGIACRAVFRLVMHRYHYVYITLYPNGYGFIKDSIFVLLAKIMGQKPILHLHTHGFKQAAAKNKFFKSYYKVIFKNTDVVCLSDRLLEDIETVYNGRVFILPNGIGQVNFVNNYKASPRTMNVLYLSNLIRGKGVLLVIEALKELKRKNINVRLRVVGAEGDLSYAELAKKVNEWGLENEVDLVGAKYGEDKYNEFRNADVFVLPSNYDTFGLVLLEAMQFGVPCIASNFGGMPDVVGEGRGVLMREINAAAMEEALEYMYLHPQEREHMSRKAFDYFEANYTVSQFTQRLLNVLNGAPDKVNESLVKTKT